MDDRALWSRIERIFHDALALPAGERADFLRTACEGDEDLLLRVHSLLAHDDLVASIGKLTANRLDQYEILGPLGEGGMGVVYRGLDTKLNRPVAIKFLSSGLADAAGRRRFQREAQLASSLSHPHILTVHDAGEYDGHQYLVTEFIDGGTLRDWVKADKRSWKQVLDLLVGVADGLAAAHAAGILHRDIKPENVLVSKNGYAKVADFGLAKLSAITEGETTPTLAEQTRPGMVIGTIPYMSPEQASGRPVDARSDVFSFGVLLYELLCGRRPFQGATNLLVLQSIIHQPAEPLGNEIPFPLQMAVEKALEKDPAERYQTMREFVVDLRRVPRIRTAGPLPGQAASRKGLWLAAVAVLLTLIVSTSFWLLSRKAASFENPLQNAHFTPLTDFPGFEEDAAISPDGKFVAFLSDRDGPYDIFVSPVGTEQFFNITKGKEQDGGVQVRRIGFSGDSSSIWIAGGGGRLRLMPVMGGEARPFLGDVVNVAWSADGTRVVYHYSLDGDPMFVADQTGGNPHQLLAGQPGMHHHYPAWSPDGKWIYFAGGTFNLTDLWRIPSSGGVAERLTETNADVRDIVPLNDRIVLYASRDKDGSGPWLWAFDVRRRAAHRISFGLEKYTSLSGSTDGRRLAATVSKPTASLWSVPILDRIAGEGDVQPHDMPTGRALAPRFAGEWLFYLSSRGTGDGLWRTRKGEVFEIWRGADSALLEAPAPSPDGRRIAVILRRQGKVHLGLLSADGAEVQTSAESIEVEGSADWSPDGKWLVIGGRDRTGEGLFKIPVEGGPPVCLSRGYALNPVWSPDGSLIVYTGKVIGIWSPMNATRPDGTSLDLPKIEVTNRGERYRFLRDGKSLIYMQGDSPSQDFWSMDLVTKKTRRLTRLNNRGAMQTFDIAPDNKHIIFDRIRENSDVVLIDLPGGTHEP